MNYRPANTTLKEPDASIVPHILLWLCQLTALAAPPFNGRRSIFSTLIITLAIYCNLHPHFTNNFDLAQLFSLAWSFYTATLAKLVFSGIEGPEERFWRVDGPAREARTYTGFGWKKFRWAAVLMFNQRGIRWNHHVKNVQPPSRSRRTRFLIAQLAKSLVCACMADFLYQVHQRVNFTPPGGQVGEMDSRVLTLRHPDRRWSLLKTFSFGGLPYFMLSMQFAQGAFLAVLLGLSEPEVGCHIHFERPTQTDRSSRIGRLRLEASKK